jgi:hypothetical protein
MTAWIDEALADAPTWRGERKPKMPWVKLKSPGDLLAGEIVETYVRKWKKEGRDVPVLVVHLERDFQDHKAGDVVRLMLYLAGLLRWHDAEKPDAGDSVVILFEGWHGHEKIIRAKAVNR